MLMQLSLPVLSIVLATVAAAIYLIYAKMVGPYRQYKFYKRVLCENYKTLAMPYDILGSKVLKRWRQQIHKYNDSHYLDTTEYPKYQTVLANHRTSILIELLDKRLIRQFYQKANEGYYQKDQGSTFMQTISSILGRGILFSEGNEWKTKRKIMSQVFNYDFIKSKVATIVEIAKQKLKQAQNNSAQTDHQKVAFNVATVYERMFGTVVIKCFFGDIEFQKIEGKNIFDFINNLMAKNTKRISSMASFLFGMPFLNLNLRKIDQEVNYGRVKFKQYAVKVVRDQVESIKRQDKNSHQANKYCGVIELLLKEGRLKEENQQNSRSQDIYTFQDLVDEFGIFFLAGTDTTANMMSFLTYLIAEHVDVQSKIRKQIQEVIGDDLSKINYENLKKMTYLDNVQKETLRMYSPNTGIFMRRANRDHFIGNIPIKKGVLVNIKIKTVHYQQDAFPDPMAFKPQRWENIDITKMQPYSYLPFSSGQRNCIGQHLSLIEGKIALIVLLKLYKSIKLQKSEYKKMQRFLYGPEPMITTFQKA